MDPSILESGWASCANRCDFVDQLASISNMGGGGINLDGYFSGAHPTSCPHNLGWLRNYKESAPKGMRSECGEFRYINKGVSWMELLKGSAWSLINYSSAVSFADGQPVLKQDLLPCRTEGVLTGWRVGNMLARSGEYEGSNHWGELILILGPCWGIDSARIHASFLKCPASFLTAPCPVGLIP